MNSNLLRLFVFASLAGFVACSSGDDTSDAGDDGAVDAAVDQKVNDVTVTPEASNDATVDAGNDVVVEASSDATSDGDTDAQLDGGSDADALAPEGTPCTPPNTIQNEPCGLCGTHYRACLSDGDGGYAWAGWGFCQGQVVNGCDPNGTYTDTACGNCGTMKTVCLSNCTFDVTQQCNEPTNACKPGKTNFQLGLSCDGGGREQTCDTKCQWGNFGACQSGPTLPKIQVPGSVSSINSLVQTFDVNTKLARVSTGTCPQSALTTSSTVYNYVVIENSTAYTATIDVWHSTAPNAVYIDSVMTVYPGTVPPDDNDATARRTCSGYTDDSCTDTTNTNPPSCFSNWAGLMKKDSHAVTILSGASVVLYSAAYFTTQGSGDFQINVKTQSLL
jgi:hypothetical protein